MKIDPKLRRKIGRQARDISFGIALGRAYGGRGGISKFEEIKRRLLARKKPT